MLGQGEAAQGSKGRDVGTRWGGKPQEEESDVSVNIGWVRSTYGNGVLGWGSMRYHGIACFGGIHLALLFLFEWNTFTLAQCCCKTDN